MTGVQTCALPICIIFRGDDFDCRRLDYTSTSGFQLSGQSTGLRAGSGYYDCFAKERFVIEPLQLLAQFDNSIKNTLKNACLLAIGSLPYSLVMAALNLLPVALFLFATSFFFRTAIFWVLIGGALVAFANSWLLRKVFKKNFGLD